MEGVSLLEILIWVTLSVQILPLATHNIIGVNGTTLGVKIFLVTILIMIRSLKLLYLGDNCIVICILSFADVNRRFYGRKMNLPSDAYRS
jgi:hypothetical protein